MYKLPKKVAYSKIALHKEVILKLTGMQLSKVYGGEVVDTIPFSGQEVTCGPIGSGAMICTG